MTDTPIDRESVERLAKLLDDDADAQYMYPPGMTGPVPNDEYQAAETLRALFAAKEAAEAERDEWRNDFRALEKTIIGDTGLSAMVVAMQARKYRPRAEAAEAKLAVAVEGLESIDECITARSELFPTKLDCLLNIQDRARATLAQIHPKEKSHEIRRYRHQHAPSPRDRCRRAGERHGR